MSTLLFQENNSPPHDYRNVSSYSRRQEGSNCPAQTYRNDSKSEDRMLKNGSRAPITLWYSGEELLWKTAEACGWENTSSVTGRLMPSLVFTLINCSSALELERNHTRLPVFLPLLLHDDFHGKKKEGKAWNTLKLHCVAQPSRAREMV